MPLCMFVANQAIYDSAPVLVSVDRGQDDYEAEMVNEYRDHANPK